MSAKGADGGNRGTRLCHVPRFPPHFPFIPVGNGINRRTLVYDKDVGRAAALAVSHPAAAGRVFNVTDGGFHSLNEIIESICAALGRKPPRLRGRRLTNILRMLLLMEVSFKKNSVLYPSSDLCTTCFERPHPLLVLNSSQMAVPEYTTQ